MLSFLICVARLFVDAWGIWVLWDWFVQPLGAPPLSYVQAMGVDLFLGLVLMLGVTNMEKDEEARLALGGSKLFAVPVVVGVSWIVAKAGGVI